MKQFLVYSTFVSWLYTTRLLVRVAEVFGFRQLTIFSRCSSSILSRHKKSKGCVYKGRKKVDPKLQPFLIFQSLFMCFLRSRHCWGRTIRSDLKKNLGDLLHIRCNILFQNNHGAFSWSSFHLCL